MFVPNSVGALKEPSFTVPASLSGRDESLTSAVPSVRQNRSVSSLSARLHWGQRFIETSQPTPITYSVSHTKPLSRSLSSANWDCRIFRATSAVEIYLPSATAYRQSGVDSSQIHSDKFRRFAISLKRDSLRSGIQYGSTFSRCISQSLASIALSSSSNAFSLSSSAA